MAGTNVRCTCCGNDSLIEFKDFDRMEVDMTNLTTSACRVCRSTLQREPKIVAIDGEPPIITKFRKIMKDGAAGIRYEGRSYTVDSFSASAVIAVWDKLSEQHRIDWMSRHNGNPVKMADLAFRLINKTKV